MAYREALYKPEHCDTAIQVLSNGESLAAVCDEIGICRATLYNWKESHPDFALAINFGLQKCQRRMEALGHSGMVGELEKFLPTQWMFVMKNRFREDYAEEKADKTVNDTIVEKLIDKLVD